MSDCRPVYNKGWNEEHKLLLKMVEVYKEVQYIQKRGKNKFHGYSYATEADVNEKVRDELSKRNVIMIPGVIQKELRNTTTKSGNTEYIYRVDMEFTFMDADTGENLIVPMSGEGQDVGDKAIFKAISGCQKYALMKAFMIPTGDDPEGDEGVDERNHGGPAQTQKIYQPSTSGATTLQTGTSQPAASNSLLATEGQAKMINIRTKEIGCSFERITDHLGYEVKSGTDVKKSDVNKLLEFISSLKEQLSVS